MDHSKAHVGGCFTELLVALILFYILVNWDKIEAFLDRLWLS